MIIEHLLIAALVFLLAHNRYRVFALSEERDKACWGRARAESALYEARFKEQDQLRDKRAAQYMLDVASVEMYRSKKENEALRDELHRLRLTTYVEQRP